MIGYGKMGKMIEGIALSRGHEISCRIDKENQDEFDSKAFRTSDVAIEFTTPATGYANVVRCIEAGIPVVCGTTGWVKESSPTTEGKTRLEELRERCGQDGGTLMWASNYSVGVNVFKAVNRHLAHIMNRLSDYTPYMTETHHIHKLDHPSGTAITLADQIVSETERISGWSENPEEGKLTINHIRESEVPGIHTIKWDSAVDDITITHSAKSRGGFALGAVMAAEWLAGKQGYHDIDEMMEEILR